MADQSTKPEVQPPAGIPESREAEDARSLSATARISLAEEWSDHLTPPRRRHFERVGQDLVTRDVSEHRYKDASKEAAALAWIEERNSKRERREKWTFRLMIAGLVVAVVFGIVSVL